MVYWIYKMPKKKSWLQENQTLIGLIIIAIILWKMGESGMFSKTATYNIENVEGDTITNQETINQLENPTPGDLCTIDCVPNNINLGQSSTCTLRDGINANCLIYFRYNSGDWKYLATVTTDSGGIYRETRTPGYAGYYEFAAICDDCVTNKETVIVNTPTDDSDDDSSSEDTSYYTCGLSSWCYAGTCPPGYFCEKIDSLYATWCACINNNGEVHPEWKPDGDNYNPIECSDSDNGYTIFTRGTCTDGTGTYEDYCYDNEIGDKVLWEYTCVDNKCVGQKVNCPYMNSACGEGACWELN